MLERMTSSEFDHASTFDTSHAVFEALRIHHAKLGPYAQINLLLKEFTIFYDPAVPMTTTSKELRDLHERMKKMGKIDEDHLFLFVIINALGRHYPLLQSEIHKATDDPNFNSSAALRRIETEAALTQRRAKVGVGSTSSVALVGTTGSDGNAKASPMICSNCKHLHHTIEFCIKQGGKMAGRTLEEAKAAQRAAAGKAPRSAKGTSPGTNANANVAPTTAQNTNNAPANTATTTPSSTSTTTVPSNLTSTGVVTQSNSSPIIINGVSYVPISTPSVPPQQSVNICDHTGMPYRVNDLLDFRGMVAELDLLRTSLDWDKFSNTADPQNMWMSTVAFPSTSPTMRLDELPFVLDSGATCYISPERSDFRHMQAIHPHPIKGLGGATINALGMGTIQLDVRNGQYLTLHNALFAPSCSVRLISVSSLNRDSKTISCFDEDVCWVLDKQTGAVIVHGTISVAQNLYSISTLRVISHIVPNSSHPSDTSLYASRVPDIETWHHRLGHCNTHMLIDMAQNNAVKGMPINLSALPPRCEHCILGKQARTSVPKMWEGSKATRRLERVFIDLCGPMSVPSKNGYLYAMNIIDDYSSYVWTIPLKNKGDAAEALQVWHRLVENQIGERLKVFVTDNGELLSHIILNWCATFGIEHLLTAPYTSAHNGRVERLHRTLLEKARTMRLACNAPTYLWDEFFATAAYLTTLTPSSSISGKTPFELWFGHPPSLSHLREIGCKAFALILTHNPKLLQWSVPCILIGYAPHAKAYRLWNPASGRVFNSFHITFIEHLDSIPDNLLPGMLVNIDDKDLPPSWDTAAPETPNTVPISRPSSEFINLPPSSINNQFKPSSTIVSHLPISSSSIPNSISSGNIPSNFNLPSPSVTPSVVVTPPSPPPRIPSPPPAHIPSPPPARVPSPPPTRIPSPPPPPLRRSPRNHVPFSRDISRDGLLPDTRLSGALSDVRASALRRQEERAARHAAQSDDHTETFLAEFAPLRRTHLLLAVDLDPSLPASSFPIDQVLSGLADGNIEPIFDSGDEPSWTQALASPEREYWIAGGHDELKSLEDLKVFVLVPRSDIPRGQRPLKGKLVPKRKRDDMGNVVRYKVRYVAKGYAQCYGIDYDKTAAPTVRLESFHTLLHIAASLGWDIQHFDIKTAFLHGILPKDETMYMEQPPGFEAPGKEDWVMKLMKSIYGMKQASRVWNTMFDKAVKGWGFRRLPSEWCIYWRQTSTGTIIFAVHVDDIISIASNPDENEVFKSLLKDKWDITDLGPAKFALGIAISRDLLAGTISISQTALIDRVVDQFNQRDAHPVDTPMVAGIQLQRPNKNDPTPPEVTAWAARTPYRSLVGSLMYIAIGTRPDIAYAVGRLTSFLDCYRPEHWGVAIRVLRYLKGTRSLSLKLGGPGPLHLVGYSDSDYANCPDTSRSIGGYCFSLGSGMISWGSRKQRTVADSSCYAEYIALHDASHEAVFLRELLDGLDLLPSYPTPIHCDNDAASILSEDHLWHPRVKHIRVKYHYIRELVSDGEVKATRISSSDNIADILTKPLARADYLRLRSHLGLCVEEK